MVFQLFTGFVFVCLFLFCWFVVWGLRRFLVGLTQRDQLRLLYFYRDKCRHCQAQADVLTLIQDHWGRHIAIEHVNGRTQRKQLRRYRVKSFPTILIVDHLGEVRHINQGMTNAGILSQQLENLV